MLKYAAVFTAAILAAGCACAPATPALFVVLPAADGHVGKIVVQSGAQTGVVESAYGAQRVRSDGRVEAATLSEGEVRTIFGSTLSSLPGKPTSFTLYFLEGKDELTPESKVELEKVFSELKRRPLPDVMVIGHTDTVGGLEYNDRLSRARADRLRDLLVELGLPGERIQAAGRGKRELLVPTEENISEARNRRVEISVR
ncbi:MAG: OmpA family protein [Pseudomonadota bacterium]|nr:OmpA family protein [Pseudomonadota bacterium]